MKLNNIEMDFVYDWSKKNSKKVEEKEFFKEDIAEDPIMAPLKKEQ